MNGTNTITPGWRTSEFFAGPLLGGVVAGYGFNAQPATMSEAVATAAAILGMAFVQVAFIKSRTSVKGGAQ